MEQNQCTLTKELTEEDFAEKLTPFWYSYCYLEILDMSTDLENEIANVYYNIYANYRTYYTVTEYYSYLTWDAGSMTWTYDNYHMPQSETKAVITSDLTTHYEYRGDSAYVSLDIEKTSEDSDTYILKNFYYKYVGGIAYVKEYTTENQPLTFFHTEGRGLVSNSMELGNYAPSLTITIADSSLYYYLGGGRTEVRDDLPQGWIVIDAHLWKGGGS